MEEWTEPGRSLQSVKKEVKRAIEGHAKGESDGYALIKEIFTPRRRGGAAEVDDSSPNKDMKTYLLALSSYASILGRNCNGLVKTILACDWMGREENFIKVYVHFLGSLASAQGSYVDLILRMLVDSFQGGMISHGSRSFVAADIPTVKASSGRLPDCPTVTRDQLYSRVHNVLKHLLNIVPSAAALYLLPLLSLKFPPAEDDKKFHTLYIENLIRLVAYAPSLKSDVLALITTRLVEIDVQMQLDLDDVDDDIAGAVVQALSLSSSSMHDEDSEGDSDSDDSDADSVASDESLPANMKRVQELQGNVEKMDAILDRLFTIYEPHFADPNSNDAVAMFETLTGHFTNIILPTYHSRHTQFLLFHYSQKSEILIDHFAGHLVNLAFDSSRPAVLRQSAAAYLASFVARGAHVPAQIVRTVFELIEANSTRSATKMTPPAEDQISNATHLLRHDPSTHLYILFPLERPDRFVGHTRRGRPCRIHRTGSELDSRYQGDHSPNHILETQSSQGLLSIYCHRIAKISRHLRFLYIYPLLETNKRIRLSQFTSQQSHASGDAGNDDSWHQLDAYFPFDPYQLPISKRWVEDDYVQWRGIPGLDVEEDEDSEDESDGEDDDDAEEEEEDTATDEEH